MLLYPHSNSVDVNLLVNFGKVHQLQKTTNVKVGFVSVLDENNYLDTKIGKR